MCLTAPFYFTQRTGRGNTSEGSVVAVMYTPDTVGGVACEQVLVELRPGLGKSEIDRVLIAIARDSRRVLRLRFSLEGFRQTRGVAAEVLLSRFQEVAGLTLPTQFQVTVHGFTPAQAA